MGNAVQIVVSQPTHVIYIAFCKNEKKCGDIRNTQVVALQPTQVNLFCFSRGEEKENEKNFVLM